MSSAVGHVRVPPPEKEEELRTPAKIKPRRRKPG